ncbi:MAG: hypothetical protein EP344_13255, partial [Bacteroidetes bacterium]
MSFNQLAVRASASVTSGKSAIHCFTDIDITIPRSRIKKHFEKTGEKLSFTAYTVACLSNVIKDHPQCNSFIKGRKLIMLDDITINVLIERGIAGEQVPVHIKQLHQNYTGVAKKINYNYFIDKYITPLPIEFKWQEAPLQVYPLELISNHLALPTPLLQADYHFFVYMSAGRFSQQIGIENYNIHAPCILYVPEGETFSINSKQNKIYGFFILIENKVISSIADKVEISDLLAIDTITNLNSRNNQWFKTACFLLYNEVSLHKYNRKVVNGLLQAILHKLIALNSG